MIEDVYEPLSKYRDEFKERFAKAARDEFAALTERSGIDVAANRATVRKVRAAEKEAAAQRGKKGWLAFLLFLLVAAILGALAGAFYFADQGGEVARQRAALCGAGAAAAGLLMFWAVPAFRKVAAALKEIEARIESLKAAALAEMEPLNRLYTWDIPARLIERTVPRLDFDPYFCARRLEDLQRVYDWDGSFNDGKSVLFAQSGVINGNPFVVGNFLAMEWGTKTYTGCKTIHWTDWETDPNGRRRRVSRSQTLTATVTKPIPVYSTLKTVIYGNDAAPKLSFSRAPSGLDSDGGFFNAIKKKWRLRRLKAYSEDLTDDSNFTLMSNHEFETWFHAKNRDDEVEFRMLFTPVAQTQMLALMKDKTTGFGDDFEFAKSRKINILTPAHLQDAAIDTDPARFRHWDYDAARENFIEFNEAYFRNMYFALAPLLAIPLYQQTRSHEDIWKGVIAGGASFWECESLANYYGEEKFRHPRSITRNILKARVQRREAGASDVAITAHGYSGRELTEYVSVHGGDGNWHDVPVKWTEYSPVQKTSRLTVVESEEALDAAKRAATAISDFCRRRTLCSFFGE